MFNITDAEFATHIAPMVIDNWLDAHPEKIIGRSEDGLTRYHAELTDAEYDEMDEWAEILREQYEDGSFGEPEWR